MYSEQTRSLNDKKFEIKKVNLFFNEWLKIFLYFSYCFVVVVVVYDDIMCILYLTHQNFVTFNAENCKL